MILMLQQHTALRAASPGAHPDCGPRNDLRGITCPSLTVLKCLLTYGSPQHHIPTARGSLQHNCPWTEVCCNPCNLTCLRTHLYPPPCPTHRCPTHTELRCVRTVHLSPLQPRQQMHGLCLFTAHTELCDALHHQRCVCIPCSQRTRPLHHMRLQVPCSPWLAALLYRARLPSQLRTQSARAQPSHIVWSTCCVFYATVHMLFMFVESSNGAILQPKAFWENQHFFKQVSISSFTK
jgi:hypothetical protein